MENLVQIHEGFFINLEEAVTVEARNNMIIVTLRERDGSLTEHFCHSSEPGYKKLKKILDESVSN
jgi:hypothetical protein